MTATTDTLLDIYHRLLACYGPQHWWPAEDAFEVIVGAILTQSAAWTNVEKAIANLKAAGALTPQALLAIPADELSTLIHACGYYNAKARKLKAFAERLHSRYGGDLKRLLDEDAVSLRQWLLHVHGIGEETADSIILYAAEKPVFVVDAYTRRILRRSGLAPSTDSYGAFQALFMENLPRDEALYNEYHALLVRHGKETCRPTPRCPQCCLRQVCPQGGAFS
jgi:endonuclease-3 related protein